MSTRRAFMQKALGGSAALAAYGLFPSSRVLGANDRIRIGLIGAGGRGTQIFKAALKCPNVEGVAVADIYTRRLDAVESESSRRSKPTVISANCSMTKASMRC